MYRLHELFQLAFRLIFPFPLRWKRWLDWSVNARVNTLWALEGAGSMGSISLITLLFVILTIWGIRGMETFPIPPWLLHTGVVLFAIYLLSQWLRCVIWASRYFDKLFDRLRDRQRE